MANSYVGAGILNIITESLYDNPIVVFREYVQNSMDSILKQKHPENCEIKIWEQNGSLYFLDNGGGIPASAFVTEMKKIGGSNKKKQRNLGYKGIGRLSGVPYCNKLHFFNIHNYAEKSGQQYTINGTLYENIKNEGLDSELEFTELMDKIGFYASRVDFDSNGLVSAAVHQYSDILQKTNTGFLVVLEGISAVLKKTMDADDFFQNLQWLLPVDFDQSLYENSDSYGAAELFKELTSRDADGIIPIRYGAIFYNDKQIFRPIRREMFREYICKNDFKYAIGFHTFSGDKIAIDKKNCFTGIRIYVDNMLLCDENELLQSLKNYELLSHTLNNQIQSVRGIGAMIYITDKVNISANARRTFIEVTDEDSLEFLKLLAEFVNTVYDTRYALSNYASAKVRQEKDEKKLAALKSDALGNLRKLAREEVELPADNEEEIPFDHMSIVEKKRVIKKKISSRLDQRVKEYLKETRSYRLETAFKDFWEWLKRKG